MNYLIADIGGTNARFAIFNGEKLSREKTLSTADYESLLAAIAAYLDGVGKEVNAGCLAVACPINDDQVSFTNNPWSFSISKLKGGLGFAELHVINDFEAMARSLSFLEEKDLFLLGPKLPKTKETMAILGPGTGLGMAALRPYKGEYVPLATEGGHARFAPSDSRQQDLVGVLSEKLGFVCNEDLLSGYGLVNIYRGLCSLDKKPSTLQDPAGVCEAALTGTDSAAQEALDMFWSILGAIAGDYALQTGALGGVYIAGGITPRYLDSVKKSSFRENFESKGSYRKYMEKIPTYVVTAEQPGLLGAAALFIKAGDGQ